MGKVKSLFIWTLVLAIAGCASGHCRMQKSPLEQSVFVFKSDGSKQCGMGEVTSLETMAQEFVKLEPPIKILSQVAKKDGKMYAQVCGGPTGRINVYEISAQDLGRAQSLGFEVYRDDN